MNRDRIEGICRQLGGALREQWGTLSDDPYAVAAGRLMRREGRNQEQRGLARREADRQLAEFIRRHRNWRDLSGS